MSSSDPDRTDPAIAAHELFHGRESTTGLLAVCAAEDTAVEQACAAQIPPASPVPDHQRAATRPAFRV